MAEAMATQAHVGVRWWGRRWMLGKPTGRLPLRAERKIPSGNPRGFHREASALIAVPKQQLLQANHVHYNRLTHLWIMQVTESVVVMSIMILGKNSEMLVCGLF